MRIVMGGASAIFCFGWPLPKVYFAFFRRARDGGPVLVYAKILRRRSRAGRCDCRGRPVPARRQLQ